MKISVVTPAYNMEKYLAETIESVLAQKGDFEVEYIIVNDGSTDRTEQIVLDAKSLLKSPSFEIKYAYQPNQGMYSAINKGFSLATGDIYAWIGGDDVYRPDTAFASIVEYFKSHPESQWVKGMCGLIDADGKVIRHGRHRTYRQSWLAQGIYGLETYFVEQESVFWKPELWKQVAPIPTKYRSAGDYWLWTEFAKYSPLESIPVQVAYFRIRPGQISGNRTKYIAEQREICPRRSIVAYLVRARSIITNRLLKSSGY